jgi:DNA-binding response OmpR family regulator
VKKKVRKTPLLVVDDDRTVRKLLTRIAERSGFDVDSAKDGIEALEMMEKKDYEIAIVDLMMPRLSGYELVQKIGALVPRPTVIVATALMNGDVASLDDSMVRRVIRKPFDIAAVAAALIETAQEITAQRAADAAAGQEPPHIVLKDTKVLAKEAATLSKDATTLAEQASELSGEGGTDLPPKADEAKPREDKPSSPKQH